jgi:TrmH family RNA methyltransferase
MSTQDVIRSRANPLVRRFRALKEGVGADPLALLEGPKLLEEAVLSGIELIEVALASRCEHGARGGRLVRELEARGVPIRRMRDDVLESLSEAETSQGILALARRPRFEEDELYAGTPLLVVAVAIQNPGNVGGLLRTAEAAGATGAYLTDGTADPFSWKALRGSMGSAFRLPHLAGLGLAEVARRLASRGVKTVATAAEAPTRYDEADLRRPLALLLGNESAGLAEEVLRGADSEVSIPMAGRVDSLNVGVAAGVVLFEAARQRRTQRA